MPISRASGDRSRTASAAASCARCSDDRGMTLSLACLPDPRGGQPRPRRPAANPAGGQSAQGGDRSQAEVDQRHRRTDCAPVGDRGGTDTPRDRTCCPDAGGGQHHVGDLQRGRVRPCSDSADSSSMSTEIVPSATTIPAPATTQSSTATDAGQPGTASSDWPPTRPRPRPGRGRRGPTSTATAAPSAPAPTNRRTSRAPRRSAADRRAWGSTRASWTGSAGGTPRLRRRSRPAGRENRSPPAAPAAAAAFQKATTGPARGRRAAHR